MNIALSLLIGSALMSTSPLQVSEPQQPAELEPMVVVTSRSPRPVSDVAGVVSVVDAAQMDFQQVRNIDDLVRYEVGISAETAGTRFGIDGFNIRGVGGNRVAIEVDGVPMGQHFDIGSFASAGRGLVDPEFIQRVEILRGPASTLYGSDAIGGVAAFFTWDPADLLQHARGDSFYRLRGGYDGADDSTFASGLAAWNVGQTGLVAGVVRREGSELDHAVPADAEDKVAADQTAFLGKLVYDDAWGNQWRLVGTSTDARRDSDIQSILGQGRFRSTTLLLGDDEQSRERVSLSYDFSLDDGWLDGGALRLYRQDMETDQFTVEERAARDTRRQRRFLYEQQATGFESELFHSFEAVGASHRLGFGLDYNRTETEELRNAVETDLSGNGATSSILGENFPLRDFPNSTTEELGLWIQDEITWDRLTLIPALRYEDYALDPNPDAIYREDFPDTEVVSIDDSELTPKLGALYAVSDDWTVFGQYTRGFRAPPFEDANIGLEIPLFNIRAIPNPDLKSESSDGYELGIRHYGARQQLEAVVFYNDYSDFIETKVNLGPDPQTGVLLFQSRNVTDAEIYGAEVRYERELGDWAPGFTFHGSGFWARGEDKATGESLNGLDPAEAIIGLRWNSPDNAWQLDLMTRAAEQKDEVSDEAQQFRPSGYGVLDILAQWTPNRHTRLGLGLFNVADREHWRWQDVRGLGPDDPVLPLLSRPGRRLSATLEVRW